VLLVEDIRKRGIDQFRALAITGPAPGIEGAALEFRQQDRLAGGACLRDIRYGLPNGRMRAVESLRIEIPAADLHRALAGDECLIVVADQWHPDPVRARLFLEVRHVLTPG